jgi:hypothetical protein
MRGSSHCFAFRTRALDAEHMQLTSDVAEGEEGSGLHFTAFDLGSK